MHKTFSICAMVLFSGVMMFQSFAEARTVLVTGRGIERSFCNANSGNFCLTNIKRRAEQTAGRDAQSVCERNRGRALTYTTSYSSYCNPSYLPGNHDGVYVRCESSARMQCELND
jgi:hypothetical protein